MWPTELFLFRKDSLFHMLIKTFFLVVFLPLISQLRVWFTYYEGLIHNKEEEFLSKFEVLIFN